MHTISPQQLDNLRRHSAHIHMLANTDNDGATRLLAEPTDRFVRALATATTLLAQRGKVPGGVRHRKRAATMLSPTKAIRTKKKAVTSQQGRGFFQDVAKAVVPVLPAVISALA